MNAVRVLLTLLLTASSGSAIVAQTTPQTVNIATYGSTLGSWCVYGAEAGGYFTKNGIKIGNTVVLYGDPAIVSALTSGQADIVTAGAASIIPAANGQSDQLVVIGSTEGSPVSLITPPSITSPAQLVGKTIALPAHNTSNEAIGTALVNAYVGKDKWKPLYIGGASTGRLAAVVSGQAAGAYINDPVDRGDFAGLHVLTHFGASQKLYNNGLVMSTRNWLKANPDAAVRFMGALAKGCDFVLDPKNRSAAIDLLVKGGPLSETAAADAYDYYVAGPFRGNTPPVDGRLDPKAFANAVQLLKDEGIITNAAFDYRSVIDFSALDKALKK
ncbi:MAG: ABC transporter substrate-binding protein [Candidatus Lustribacter sp.]|jgi:ABC-type nitrate/sulfonate/bicarbonate transport system substrate-binding protein